VPRWEHPLHERRVAVEQVVAMTRSEGAPSLDEYATARGADLLRTAWLLTGDGDAARRLVAVTLGREARHWGRLAGGGSGGYDLALRRQLLRAFLSRHRPAQRHSPAQRHPPAQQQGGATGLRAALDRLSPVRRAVVVLRFADDLDAARVADLLDVSVAAVNHRASAALAELGVQEGNLRAALPALVPADLPTEGIAAAATRYAGRGRRVRAVLSAVSAAAVLALAAMLAATVRSPSLPPSPDRPSPTPVSLSCKDSRGEPEVLTRTLTRLSSTASRLLVCARTDADSVWTGSLPPDAPISLPAALDLVEVSPRTDGRGCPDLPNGPAYRLLLLARDGSVRTFANEGLACNGWPVLASYYVALAEQQAGSQPDPAGFLGCPDILNHLLAERAPTATASVPRGPVPGVPRGTVFTEATACLHPLARADRIPRFVQIRSNVLGEPQLAELDADAARAGSTRNRSGSKPLPCAEATSVVVVRAMTADRRLVELSSRCGVTMTVDWSAEDIWPVSADTAEMLRSLLVVG
jgi:DNA-directed RNA polymerase specialized sigma24 family protein